MDNMLNKVLDTIKEFDMFKKSERLLVCLSGGADSVSLLLCLNELGYDICACHVNHQLRGRESERDQQFCEELCKKLNIELSVHRIDVNAFCKENAVSIEEGARELRYRIFDSIKADKICTAHTLSDCIETTVFNLARGTGLKGLCSIPPKRDRIVRPLINCTREEIIDYLKAEGQDFVTDSTNLTDEYTRNKVRHNIIPQLLRINPSLMKSYANTVSYLRKDLSFLERTADKAFDECCCGSVINLTAFHEFDDCIKDRVIMRWLERNGLVFSHEKLPLIYKIIKTDGKLNIAKESFIVCKNNSLFIDHKNSCSKSDISPVGINGDGKYCFAGRNIDVKIIKMENIDCDFANVHKMFANCCLDYDKIIGGIVLRSYSEGDKIRLVNRNVDYSIRKLLKNNFSLDRRKSAVIMYDDIGAVFVEGSGACERVKISETTKNMLTFAIDDII